MKRSRDAMEDGPGDDEGAPPRSKPTIKIEGGASSRE
jgi:hypothetical protein